MKKTLYIIRDIAITVGIQLVCFMVCLWIQNSTVENALIPAVSIFGVFLTSVITPGYLYGVAAAILSVLEVNFAFTFPFFHFNFSIPDVPFNYGVIGLQSCCSVFSVFPDLFQTLSLDERCEPLLILACCAAYC